MIWGVDDVVTSVVLMVNGTSYTATKTADPNTYTADVSMTDLANDTQIVAHVTAQDKAGNVATVNGERAYDVNLSAPQVTIKLDPIANDNIIDETERTGDSDGNIIITGKATGDYNDQDDVVVSLGNSTYPAKLTAQGTFSVAIPADTLTKDSTKSITATLSTKNSVGNTATVSDTVGYAVQSNELQIIIDPITADNLINESEVTGEIVITGSVSGADRLLNQPVTLTIGGQDFETTANADGVFELLISASVLKDVPTYTIVATATGQNNAKASTNLAYKVGANVAAQIDITNIDGNFGLSVAQEESIVRIGGQFEFDGVFGKGMNDMHVRHVSVKIGDKTYYSGLDRGKFFFDVPFDELQALNGQSLSYEFIHNPNAKLYDLTDLGGGAYQITDSNTNWQINADGKNTATIKEVTIDSPYLTKGADGNYSVAVSDEPMSVVSGVVSGSAKADDVVSIDVAGTKYTAVVGADNTFKAMVKTSDLDKDDDSLVVASLATQDLAGNAITVQDTERFVNANRMSKELVFTRPSNTEPTNLDHTSPDNDMAYFIKYLNSHKMETKPFSIPVGGYATEPAIVKYHFATPDDYHVLKERYTRGVQGEVNADLSTLKPYTEAMKNIVRKAYDEYASYANIKFIEVDDPLDADTNLFSANLTGVHSGSSAYAFLGGNIWWSNGYANVQSGHSPFAYYTALHEIGHTLNMRHTHDNFKGDYLPEDSLEFSVLSYKPYMNYSMYLNMGGLRMYDLAHIHRQFGVNPNARSGDDVYTFKNYNTVLGDGDRYIWDGNGVDTFDASNETQGVNVNLTLGSWIYVGDERQKTFAIKNLSTVTFADYFDLNDTDTLIGGVGDDTYIIDSTGDSITELAGEGVDSVFSHVDFDLNGQELENLTLIGITAKTATGNELDNVLTANNMGNTLIGNAGNDTLIGGLGADILTGGDGDDIFVFSTLLNGTMDTITDFEMGDKIKLDKAVFDVDASTLTERITYNKDTKVLSYDADGEGGADAIDFAKVEGVFEVKLDNFIL
ncbi:Ig-like domain-containing protein [Moraxella lacunata]|uniref:Peptidase metallopeptidase domain-containing protein n=1 Tax=Moraxella lacunata TaxID=477 RepID=A0A1V4GZF0_MORLA|nr:Ig-like domain-containing protein [Moraxella lacunata]OPH38015.1 hypothetical protein B5J94_04610 [Moraxella lacunata]